MARIATEYDPAAMDKAAMLAEAELQVIELKHLTVLANWWKKHYLAAGHKRLGRVLLKHAGKVT